MERNLVYDEKAIVEVTKEFTFDSAHYLQMYDGKCANMHGHTYKLQVTVMGTCNEIGMIIDFNKLKEVVKDQVIDKMDHQTLNNVFPSGFNTTAENMSVWIFNRLDSDSRLKGVKVVSIKLWETPTSYAEYKGERL